MNINRIVPDLHSSKMEESKAFYAEFLGLTLQMDMGWVATLVSPSNPAAQITLLEASGTKAIQPDVSIEVDDAAALHAEAVKRGLEVVYPLTEEPWKVRRFFVKDPSGHIINIVSHC